MAAATTGANGAPPIDTTRLFLLLALNDFERHTASSGKISAPAGISAKSTTADATQNQSSESIQDEVQAAPTKQPTKSQRRARLQRLREITGVEEARRLTSDILTEWNGAGLHIFEAIKILAAFASETITAIEMLFTALEKLAQAWGKEPIYQHIWQKLKSDEGRAGRYIKRADRTLTQLICQHWHLSFKAKRFDTLDWSSVMLRSLRIFSVFSKYMVAPTRGNKWSFDGPKQMMLPSTGATLRSVHGVQYSRLVVDKVVGNRLPQELVDMIIARLSVHTSLLKDGVRVASESDSKFRCRMTTRK
ncbi:hypothetical protein BST61_g280 [Cercospora zeina]